MKLGITQRVDSSHGERRDCLAQDWSQLLNSLGHSAVPLPNQPGTAERWITEFALEGIILSGGNDVATAPGAKDLVPERDRFEGELIAACAKHGLPLLGVCRGMQMLLSHSGAIPRTVPKHAGSTHALVQVTNLPGFKEGQQVNSFHNYGFDQNQVTPPWSILALAGDGTVEAVKHTALPFWGVLWHPERAPRLAQNELLLNAIFKRSGP